jgi:DNA-binding transcriptional LysR family regulator
LFNRTSRRVALTPIGQALYEDLRPARDQIEAGLDRAVKAARGITGTLRVGFVGAAGGQLLSDGARLLPDCEVVVREVQLVDAVPWLLSGEVEVLLTCFPDARDELVTGPPLVTETRMLAVPAGHALAKRRSVSVSDLAGVDQVRTPDDLPGSQPARRSPADSPAAESFQEALTLVGASRGVLPISAHIRRYYARPDVEYVVLRDAPPVHWHLMWRADTTARVQAFVAATHHLVKPST